MNAIGNTPLRRLEKTEHDIFVKLEGENPAGSIKDRVAFAIIEDAEKNGRLKAGGTVIEATSGNTGIGLAYVASQKGYKAVIVMPDTMSVERQALIKAYGGEVVLTDGKKGMQGAVEKAKALLAATPNSILADQFNNPVCWKVHYQTTGREIWAQTQGKVDIFVACVGTGGTLTGVGKYLKEQNPNIQVIAVEPASAPLLSKGVAGSHGIQGIGANFIPENFDSSVVDRIIRVSEADAYAVAKDLARLEGILCGISSGAALHVAAELTRLPENKGKTIVALLPDTGDRYLSTPLFD